MRCYTCRFDEVDIDSQDIVADAELSLPTQSMSVHYSFVGALWLYVPLQARSIRVWTWLVGTAIVLRLSLIFPGLADLDVVQLLPPADVADTR